MKPLTLPILLFTTTIVAAGQEASVPSQAPQTFRSSVDLVPVDVNVIDRSGRPIADLKARYADLGLDIASKEQQTPEGLAAFNKAEIDKWWPIIKSANIKQN